MEVDEGLAFGGRYNVEDFTEVHASVCVLLFVEVVKIGVVW